MKTRVGIVSMFHASRNFGGLLQAFALCKFLNNQDFDAKQIDLPQLTNSSINSRISRLKNNPKKFIKALPNSVVNRLYNFSFRFFHKKIYEQYLARCKTIEAFRSAIPHIDKIKDNDEIDEYNKYFDVFICGSDQIWNPCAYRKEYFLEFVHENKKKFSYGASIAKITLTEEEKMIIGNSLQHLDRISVREENARELLVDLVEKPIEVVLDPTMLITKNEWEALIPARRCEGKYIFYYVFENDSKRVRFAKNLSHKMGYKLVCIPHICSSASLQDIINSIDDIQISTPLDFLSLIRNAELIITDSFHAVVFSLIFEKQFICFECKKTYTLYPRLSKLLKMYKCEDRYLPVNDMDPMKKFSEIDFECGREILKENRIHSIRFLEESISN